MPIDSLGKMFLKVSRMQAPYVKELRFTAPDGSSAYREEFIQPNEIETNQYNLGEAGWHRELTHKEISKQTVYRPIEGSLSFRKTTTIVLSVYRVIPDRKDALLKSMPSGVFLRQFKESGKDLTIYYPLSNNQLKSGNYTLLSERELTLKEAKTMIESNQAHCIEIGLRKDLGLGHI